MGAVYCGFGVEELATAWAKGWTLTRDKASPVGTAYGCKIDLGLPGRLERHVVVDFDAPLVRELADGLVVPGTWLKVCAAPGDVAPLLHERWQVQAPEYLMAVDLGIATAQAPDGYRLVVTTTGAVIEVEVRDQHGALAARGRAAHSGGFATFDQIVTEPEHQRRGLGRLVMAALGNYAIAQGAEVGVLVATEQGRALYESIGWTLASPVTAAVVRQNAITVEDSADPAFENLLGKGLEEFNLQAAGFSDQRPLCVAVRDPENGEALGGIVGRTSLGLAFLDLFHLPASLRGTGLGTAILEAFEGEARKRGCRNAVLYTISFQAPGFYEKNGWVKFGEVESDMDGISRVFMKKRL